jgi:hypothetical protein
MLSKRGKPNKVDEAFMSRCNSFGISPFENETRLNLRTVSGRTRERLEKSADERHSWALQTSQAEMQKLKVEMDAAHYLAMLEKEGLLTRAKKQKAKDHDLLQNSKARETKLTALVTEAEAATKRSERKLRGEINDGDKVWSSLKKAEAAGVELQTTLMARCDEVANMKRQVLELEVRVRHAETNLRSAEVQHAGTLADLVKLTATYDHWKERDAKSKRLSQKRTDELKTVRDNLTTVKTLMFVAPLMFDYCDHVVVLPSPI